MEVNRGISRLQNKDFPKDLRQFQTKPLIDKINTLRDLIGLDSLKIDVVTLHHYSLNNLREQIIYLIQNDKLKKLIPLNAKDDTLLKSGFLGATVRVFYKNTDDNLIWTNLKPHQTLIGENPLIQRKSEEPYHKILDRLYGGENLAKTLPAYVPLKNYLPINKDLNKNVTFLLSASTDLSYRNITDKLSNNVLLPEGICIQIGSLGYYEPASIARTLIETFNKEQPLIIRNDASEILTICQSRREWLALISALIQILPLSVGTVGREEEVESLMQKLKIISESDWAIMDKWMK